MSNLADRGLKPVSELGARRPHGDRLRYSELNRINQMIAANEEEAANAYRSYEYGRALADATAPGKYHH